MTKFRVYVTELTGTFFLVFIGCSSIAVNQAYPVIGHLGISITFGLIVAINIYAFGHISGCHINPAVTIAFAVVRLFPWKHVLPYIIFQIAGAALGSFAGYLVFGNNFFASVTLPADNALISAISIEFILTFLLMATIISVATDKRSSNSFAGLIIGFVILISAITGGPISGASLNPARSLGPAIVSGNFSYIIIYLTAPVIGAVSGGYLYEYIKHGNIHQKQEESYGALGQIEKIN